MKLKVKIGDRLVWSRLNLYPIKLVKYEGIVTQITDSRALVKLDDGSSRSVNIRFPHRHSVRVIETKGQKI